jgi:transcriptional regulator with XRE-family HTH domain
MSLNDFPDMLRRVRAARGLSQASVGKAAGIPQSHVARIEAGDDIRLSTAARMAEALGLKITIEPDVRRLFEHPPADSPFAAARDFGIDMSDLYERHEMSPTQRLELAIANSRGLAELLQ